MEDDSIHKDGLTRAYFIGVVNVPSHLIHQAVSMLTHNDLEQIRGVVQSEVTSSEERLTSRVHTEIASSEERLTSRIQSEVTSSEERLTTSIRSEMQSAIASSEERLASRIQSEVASSEERLTTSIRSEMQSALASSEERIIISIGELIENNILPQLDELKEDFAFMKAKMVTKFDLEDRLADFKLSLKGVV